MDAKKILVKIFTDIQQEIDQENKTRFEESRPKLKKVHLQLLGQYSLLVDEKISAVINLPYTVDVDILIKNEIDFKSKFKQQLKKYNLVYDEDSPLIWIAPESKFIKFFESNHIFCETIEPIYAILSKAIKAKEKNRVIVTQALKFYGEELFNLIQKYNGDIDYFV